MPSKAEIDSAREYFPRGLLQPTEGFRFSMDALLLSCFMEPSGGDRIADLGTGCGVVGLGLLLNTDSISPRIIGIDADLEMVAHARTNAAQLGYADRFDVVHADVTGVRSVKELGPESMDVVVCNPPYRETGTGRRPSNPHRDAARFEVSAPVSAFVKAAAYLVKNKKRTAFIGLPERLPDFLNMLTGCKLTPKRLKMVHSRHDEPAKLVLVEAVKNGGSGLVVDPPLVLYRGNGDQSQLTESALKYCPFLACNA